MMKGILNFFISIFLLVGSIGGNYIDKRSNNGGRIITDVMLPALDIDSYSTSHPISTKIKTLDDIRGAFDDVITYSKGACVLALIQTYLGKRDFRNGLQSFLTKHAFKNANRGDLWKEMSKASGKDVKSVVDTWILQQGYPLVTVARINKTHVVLKQRQFRLDLHKDVQTESPFDFIWKIPIVFKSPLTKETTLHLLQERDEVIPLPEKYSILNPNHSSFYRVKYDHNMTEIISHILHNNMTSLTDGDRAGIVSDQFSFVRANLVSIKKVLNLLSYLENEAYYTPWRIALDQLAAINYLDLPTTVRIRFNIYLVKLTSGIVKKVGLRNITTSSGGSPLQTLVLKHACQPATSVYIESTKYYVDWVMYGHTNLSTSLQSVFTECAILHGPEFFWNYAYTKYKYMDVKDVELLWALTATTKMAQVKMVLKLALNNKVIDSRYIPFIIAELAARSYPTRVLCWEFIKTNWDTLLTRHDSKQVSYMLTSVLDYFSSPHWLQDVKHFFRNRRVGRENRAVKEVVLKIEGNIQWMQDNYENLVEWLNGKTS